MTRLVFLIKKYSKIIAYNKIKNCITLYIQEYVVSHTRIRGVSLSWWNTLTNQSSTFSGTRRVLPDYRGQKSSVSWIKISLCLHPI